MRKTVIALSCIMLLGLFAWTYAQEDMVNAFDLTWSSGVITDGLWEVIADVDLDHDGLGEIIACSDSGGALIIVWEADTDGNYNRVWSYPIVDCSDSYTLCISDMDGDGLDEIVAGVLCGADQDGLWFFEWDGVVGSDNYPLATSFDLYDPHGRTNASVCALAAADLDNDGYQELVVGETRTDSIYVIQEMSGDLSFPAWLIEYQDGTIEWSPWGIVIGDFDNDGNKDFAVGEWDYNGLVIYECDATTGAYSMEFYAELSPADDGVAIRALCAADFDGNGFDELYYPSTSGHLFVITNNGDLSLIDSTNIHLLKTIGGSGFRGGVIGDQDRGFGRDGGDLYVASGNNYAVYDFEFTGTDVTDSTHYTMYEIFSTGTDSIYLIDVAVGYDVDGDGEREVFTVSSGGDDVGLFVLEHSGEPAAPFEDTGWAAPLDSCFDQVRMICPNVDTDQDGHMEFIAENHTNGGRFYVFEENGDDNYELVFTSPGEGWYYCRVVTTGDIDGDGRDEIVIAGRNTSDDETIAFYEWDGVVGSSNYIFQTTYDLGLTFGTAYHEVTDLEIADMDNDGNDELVVCQRSPSGLARGLMIVEETSGDLEFPAWDIEYDDATRPDHTTIPYSPYDVWVGDADNDGLMEAYISYWNYGGGFWYENTGTADEYQLVASLDAPTVFVNLGLDEISLVDVKSGDMDGDGYLELYSGMYTHALMVIPVTADLDTLTMNNDVPARLWPIREPWGLATGDVDGNGDPNLYWTCTGRLYDWEFTGTDPTDPDDYDKYVVHTFRHLVTDTTDGGDYMYMKTTSPFTVEVGDDLDGDGYGELIVGVAPWDYGTYVPLHPTIMVFESTAEGIRPVWAYTTPEDYVLHQNYPNPFNPNTTISYEVPKGGNVTLKIYNMLGQEVRTLVDNVNKSTGRHYIQWDSNDNGGSPVASGTYICTLKAGDVTKTMRMVLVK